MISALKSFIGASILPALPAGITRRIKRAYYLRLIRRTDAEHIPVFPVLHELVREGGFVADVGANIGVYTKLLSNLVGTSGRVRSIEPVPAVFDLLCYNAGKAGWHNVEPIHCAVSDTAGNGVMVIPRFPGGAENYYRARIVEKVPDRSMRHLTVPVRPLDDVLADWIGRVAFIKCDVEGHELRCLKGATKVISRNPPAWYVEVSGDADEVGSAASEVMTMMADAGYRVYWWNGETLVERQTGNRSIDYFFLTAEHIDTLKGKALLR